MRRLASLRSVVLLWLAWWIILLSFQALVSARFQPRRPDYALEWTPSETTRTANDDRPYLLEPFLNRQVAWDSEYYLSIATVGYEDEDVPTNRPGRDDGLPLNYAFMPFYPLMMRVMALPLRVFGLNPVATSALAGVIVSLLGTLGGMIALYDLVRDELGDDGGLRTAFYLIAFPSGFFLAQVYTEGLFVGLAFGSLALMRRRHLVLAALLAACATWTRVVGVALVIPLGAMWLSQGNWRDLDLEWKQLYYQGLPWKALGVALIGLAPLVAFVIWRFSPLGLAFSVVEDTYFGRGFLSLGTTYFTWRQAFLSLFGNNLQQAAYYTIEFGALGLGLLACVFTRKQYPHVMWFSLAVILLSFTSGPAQGMHRYVLGAPALFIWLGRLGQHPAFDRAWSILSVLLMGLLATLFTFDFWTG